MSNLHHVGGFCPPRAPPYPYPVFQTEADDSYPPYMPAGPYESNSGLSLSGLSIGAQQPGLPAADFHLSNPLPYAQETRYGHFGMPSPRDYSAPPLSHIAPSSQNAANYYPQDALYTQSLAPCAGPSTCTTYQTTTYGQSIPWPLGQNHAIHGHSMSWHTEPPPDAPIAMPSPSISMPEPSFVPSMIENRRHAGRISQQHVLPPSPSEYASAGPERSASAEHCPPSHSGFSQMFPSPIVQQEQVPTLVGFAGSMPDQVPHTTPTAATPLQSFTANCVSPTTAAKRAPPSAAVLPVSLDAPSGQNPASLGTAAITRSTRQSGSANSMPYSKPVMPISTLPINSARCGGKKKALLIGISYRDTDMTPLVGPVKDAKNMEGFLIKHFGFAHENISVLTDDAGCRERLPTRNNILSGIRWLVRDACMGDSLFFLFSGHGWQQEDEDGDECDGKDEVIAPLDYKTKGIIVDDTLHDLMVKPLPKGCQLVALIDACHSGSVLDLPYIYDTKGRQKPSEVTEAHFMSKTAPADVMMWSGCKDAESAGDEDNGSAMVSAFMRAVVPNQRQSPLQILVRTRIELKKNRHKQKSQLSCSHPIDINMPFVM